VVVLEAEVTAARTSAVDSEAVDARRGIASGIDGAQLMMLPAPVPSSQPVGGEASAMAVRPMANGLDAVELQRELQAARLAQAHATDRAELAEGSLRCLNLEATSLQAATESGGE
jgi:hypothetical protein